MHWTPSNITVDEDYIGLPGGRSLRPLSEKAQAYRKASQRPAFIIGAGTSHAPLSLAIVDAPVDALLVLYAVSKFAPARVTLHPTYEGAFALNSSAPEVTWPDAGIEDPAGLGRPFVRGETKLDKHGVLQGHVGWSSIDEMDPVGRGHVLIQATGGEAALAWRGDGHV